MQVIIPPLSVDQLKRLEEWIQRVLWDNELPESSAGSGHHQIQILRCKGLFVTNYGKEFMLQGVQTMYEICEVNGQGVEGLPSLGKLVLIGKGLDESARKSLLEALQLTART